MSGEHFKEIYSLRSNVKYLRIICRTGESDPLGYIDCENETFTPTNLKDLIEAYKNKGFEMDQSAIDALGFAVHAVSNYSEL